jgi:hypothetical protein
MTTCKEPSVYRPLRESRLQVRFADCPDNHAWIKDVCGPRTRPEWNSHHRVWLIARPRLHAIVRGLLERFELPVHVFAEFRTTEQCDHTYQNATDQRGECTCPCLGARHGTAHHNGSCPQWVQVGTVTSIYHGDGIPSLSGWCETPRVSGVLIEGGIGDPGARVHPIRQTGRVVHAGRAD